MPARAKRQAVKLITPRARQLYREGVQLINDGGHDSPALKALDLELMRELGLQPWHPTIFEVYRDGDVPKDIDDHHREFWLDVRAICEELKEG